MLIRMPDNSLRDMPDEIAAMILADPSHNDEISDCTSYDVNLIVHGILTAYLTYGEKTFNELMDELRADFSALNPPKDRMDTAYLLIKKYHVETPDDEVGMVDPRDMFQFENDKITLPPND